MRTNRGCSCKLVFPLSALSNLPSSSFRPLVSIPTCWPSALWHFQKQKAIKYKHAVSVRFFFPWSFCFHLILFSSAKSCAETPVRPGKVVMNYWSLTASSKRRVVHFLAFWFCFGFFTPLNFTKSRVGVVQTCLQIGTSMWTSEKKREKPGRPGANTRSLRA